MLVFRKIFFGYHCSAKQRLMFEIRGLILKKNSLGIATDLFSRDNGLCTHVMEHLSLLSPQSWFFIDIS